MKNYNILKWLVSLESRPFITALLLIIVSILYVDSKVNSNKNDVAKDKAYERLLHQQEICDSLQSALKIEYSKKYEDFLKEQIKKLEMNKEEVDKTILKNRLILKKFK